MEYSKELNSKQLEAVTTNSQFVRIIAGAGSGKTRVLTFRMAYLIDQLGIAPYSILAITFTNKAAAEMRNRVLRMLPDIKKENLKLFTFHAFCAYFLRQEIHAVEGYSKLFTIYDEDDQKRLVKDIAVIRGHEKKSDIIRKTLDYISSKKNEGKYPGDIKLGFNRYEDEPEMLEIYKEYEKALFKANALDFDDLLLKALFILENNVDVARRWKAKFSNILVDEFQDTNEIQYRLIQSLLSVNTSLYVVGDPDQTIYTWRGADDKIILDMDKTYKLETIILNENYRSTESILSAANNLIDKNKVRIKKDLFTNNANGEPITSFFGDSSQEEADWVVNQIIHLKGKDRAFSYRQVVILLRANYLTLNFEKALMRRQIDYKIYGGTRFYQRKEIKDAVAYIRLLTNEKDDVSFKRIANTPRRGLSTAIEELEIVAKANDYSIFEAIRNMEDFGLKSGPTLLLKQLVTIVDETKKILKDGQRATGMVVKKYLESVGLLDFYESEKDDDKRDSIKENLETFYNDIDEFMMQNDNVTLNDYIANATLLSAQDEVLEGEYVTIMTVHMAKGLEYDYVFLACLNEGVFPNARAVVEGGNKALEEERRLCYVAITRAKLRLYMSCNKDFNFVIKERNRPSSFFKEAGVSPSQARNQIYYPDEYNDDYSIYQSNDTLRRSIAAKTPSIGYDVGDLVSHKLFGVGRVVKVFPREAIIDIDFPEHGLKKISTTFKGITKVNREDYFS